MARGQRPAKGGAKPAVSRKSPKHQDARVRDLEKRLAETLALLQTRDRELAEGREQATAAHARVNESHEQQTATSEILRVISRSPTNLQPVFDVIAASAARLCDGIFGAVYRLDGETVRIVGHHNISPEGWATYRALYPRSVDRQTSSGRAMLEGRVAITEDVEADVERLAATQEAARLLGLRSAVTVPLVARGRTIGALTVGRDRPGTFTTKQLALLETFADQAVIAMENVRLCTETKEALEQQTATAEILRVIRQSPIGVQPVFSAIAESAARLTGAAAATVYEFDGSLVHLRAAAPSHYPYADYFRRNFPRAPAQDFAAGRVILDRTLLHRADLQNDPDTPELTRDWARRMDLRSVLWVPMLREGEPIGVIGAVRREAGLFSDDEVRLLQTFADQAVIAIENVRLFKELQEKNRALSESLEQQTATSEILRVISSSPTDVQPVFDAIVASAVRLCGGRWGTLYRRYGDMVDCVAVCNVPPEARDLLRNGFPRPLRTGTSPHFQRALVEGTVAAIPNVETDPDLPPRVLAFCRHYELRSVVMVPLRGRHEILGVLAVGHSQVEAFPDSHMSLLQTFADQAVIAIENVRLFKELQASNRDLTAALEQQTATSEILRVIAGSPTDLQPVLDALVESAGRLCQATDTFLLLVEGDNLRVAALHGAVGEDARVVNTIQRDWVAGRAVVDARTVHVEDLANAAAEFPLGARIATRLGHRTALATPLLREGVPIGALFLRRREVRPFSDAEQALLQIFADQAVIAIENVRLFKELAVANRELAAASQHKSEFLANMSHELRTPLNAVIGFSEVLSERMFGELNEKQEEYLKDIHASGAHLLSLINDILDLSKIEAGRMELELTDFDLPAAIDSAVMLVRERAGRHRITVHTTVDARLGQVRADERKLRQVLLNLLSNAIKFTPEDGRIEVLAALKDGLVEVVVTDTGVGIAPEDQEAVFEEFKQVGTAEKKVEGTGLGLALSRKFIELHGGTIWVRSQVGEGSTFTFTIPARGGE